MTAAQELVLVDAALEQAYTANAQSYGGPANRSKVLLDIEKLIARKKELEAQVSHEASGGFWVAQNRAVE